MPLPLAFTEPAEVFLGGNLHRLEPELTPDLAAKALTGLELSASKSIAREVLVVVAGAKVEGVEVVLVDIHAEIVGLLFLGDGKFRAV